MATSENNSRGETSLADIAATLIVNDPEIIDAEVLEDPTSGDNDVDTDEEDINELEDLDDLGSSDDQGEEQEDEQSDEVSDDEPEYLEINDDDLISVTVDGKEQELTIGELKKAHSLAGATEGRLQEATEIRKTAHAERTQMLEKLAAEETALSEALTSLDDSVFQPVVPEPTETLRRSNPEQYLRHKEAYDADQQRIGNAKQAVADRLQAIKDTRQARIAEYSQEAGKILLQEIPELGDANKSPKMLQDLAATAKAYGYTDQEIQSALDPRMFMLVRDAMRFRAMTDKTRENPDPTNLEGQKQKKVRRLRSGATQAKSRARTSDKKRKAVTAKARQTGSVKDVAQTLLVPKG